MPHRSPVFDTTTDAGRLMAATDWAATPLGDPSTWPEGLSVLVRTALSSRFPMLVLWGESYTQLYNDAYSALIGDQHPAAMGTDCRVTLAEGWPVLGPLIDDAMATGVASWVPALQLLLDRAGYREEAYFTVSHAPAADDEGVTRGVLTVCSEVTDQVVGERRLRLLQQLALDRGDAPLTTTDHVAARLAAVLASDPHDVPFAAIYLRDGGALRCLASTGAPFSDRVPLDGAEATDGPLGWGLAAAAQGRATTVEVPGDLGITGGAFGDPVTQAVALPVASSDPHHPLGVVVVGVSPSRALDELHRSFLDLLVQQVGVAMRSAQAHEEERARAEALAELDRAKTDFFTNVSHEFRTPLTLMLGPLDDALGDDDPERRLRPVQRERVSTALRASRRLAKLVNNLLTFSAVEAGSAVLEARDVDLARLTIDVAAGFRAAVERGGLTLDVDCPPLPRPVAVDPDHWETVVTNLLSNALKFTFVGTIRVALSSDGDEVRLEVADSGVGVPADELPRLFERFHRVRGTRSRSHEGSGVGLSLVHQLVTLMGGRVDVDSAPGVGTRFTVRLPWRALTPVGTPGAPAGHVLAAAAEEADSWTSDAAPTPAAGPEAARVLVADDNADMRAHLERLLAEEGWHVTVVPDGAAALEAALLDPPDLLLTDVMMPGLDGFELLHRLRADPRTATLPVVVLSARAGEGASVEGLQLGADDYVVKPFDSRDLVARLRTTMRLARERTTGPATPPAGIDQPVVPDQPDGPDGSDGSDAPDGSPGGGPSGEPAAGAGPADRSQAGSGPVPTVRDEVVLPRTVGASSLARRWLRDALAGAGIDGDPAFELALGLTEAVNNAVEHAQDPTRDEVVVRLTLDTVDGAARVVLEVQDSGRWRERRPAMDRGHGATLMALAGEVSVQPGDDGTRVTIERRL